MDEFEKYRFENLEKEVSGLRHDFSEFLNSNNIILNNINRELGECKLSINSHIASPHCGNSTTILKKKSGFLLGLASFIRKLLPWGK